MIDALPVIFNEPMTHGLCPGVTAEPLSDPWGGHFSNVRRKRVREAIGLAPEAVLVTANLDRMLGDDAPSEREATQRLVNMPFVHFILHGSVWALRSPWFRQLARSHGKRLIYAGASRRVYGDIRLIAATDLLLDAASTTAMSAGDARLVRTMALGSAFDREVRRLLLDNTEASCERPEVVSKLMRDELDRLANRCRNGAEADQRGRDDALRSCQQRKPNRGTSP